MALSNLPGVWADRQDGKLTLSRFNPNPIVLILGTAASGDSETLYPVARVSDAAKTFGSTGTLTRGMYEAAAAGALNLRLFRIGATAAKLEKIGYVSASVSGKTLITMEKDASAGADYKFAYDESADRLQVWRAADDTLVYDNNPTTPTSAVDLNEVSVSGTGGSSGSNSVGTIDDASTGVLLSAGAAPTVYTAGTDGTSLSRMELFEALYSAYKLLEGQDFDVIIPMDAYLDDLNIMDAGQTEAERLVLSGVSAYPTPGSTTDALGRVFVEEYEGENLFHWWFPDDTVALDWDTQYTTETLLGEGSNIFPSKGSATVSGAADGTFLTGSDFHEANFAYQLADFCFRQSRDIADVTGVVGVKRSNSHSLKDISLWVGSLPTTALSGTDTLVTANGTGLLGNKWMSGRVATSDVSAHSAAGLAAIADGGFTATDTGWPDGTQQKDDVDHYIDIGKHISVVATWPTLSNSSTARSYTAAGAATYGGFYSTLPPESAPTNKGLSSVRLPFRIGLTKLDQLAGQRYVTFHQRTVGVVVSDAPTAARPDSDYQRLATMRQVKSAIDEVRRVGNQFIGEGLTTERLAALETAVDSVLRELVKRGVLQRFSRSIVSTALQKVQGQATVELILVPAFELRQLTVTVSLSAV